MSQSELQQFQLLRLREQRMREYQRQQQQLLSGGQLSPHGSGSQQEPVASGSIAAADTDNLSVGSAHTTPSVSSRGGANPFVVSGSLSPHEARRLQQHQLNFSGPHPQFVMASPAATPGVSPIQATIARVMPGSGISPATARVVSSPVQPAHSMPFSCPPAFSPSSSGTPKSGKRKSKASGDAEDDSATKKKKKSKKKKEKTNDNKEKKTKGTKVSKKKSKSELELESEKKKKKTKKESKKGSKKESKKDSKKGNNSASDSMQGGKRKQSGVKASGGRRKSSKASPSTTHTEKELQPDASPNTAAGVFMEDLMSHSASEEDEYVVCDEKESMCSLCRGGDSTEDDVIMFCDGPCQYAYHQKCASVNSVPKGRWLCMHCKPFKGRPVEEAQSLARESAKRAREEYDLQMRDPRQLTGAAVWSSLDHYFDRELMHIKVSTGVLDQVELPAELLSIETLDIPAYSSANTNEEEDGLSTPSRSSSVRTTDLTRLRRRLVRANSSGNSLEISDIEARIHMLEAAEAEEKELPLCAVTTGRLRFTLSWQNGEGIGQVTAGVKSESLTQEDATDARELSSGTNHQNIHDGPFLVEEVKHADAADENSTSMEVEPDSAEKTTLETKPTDVTLATATEPKPPSETKPEKESEKEPEKEPARDSLASETVSVNPQTSALEPKKPADTETQPQDPKTMGMEVEHTANSTASGKMEVNTAPPPADAPLTGEGSEKVPPALDEEKEKGTGTTSEAEVANEEPRVVRGDTDPAVEANCSPHSPPSVQVKTEVQDDTKGDVEQGTQQPTLKEEAKSELVGAEEAAMTVVDTTTAERHKSVESFGVRSLNYTYAVSRRHISNIAYGEYVSKEISAPFDGVDGDARIAKLQEPEVCVRDMWILPPQAFEADGAYFAAPCDLQDDDVKECEMSLDSWELNPPDSEPPVCVAIGDEIVCELFVLQQKLRVLTEKQNRVRAHLLSCVRKEPSMLKVMQMKKEQETALAQWREMKGAARRKLRAVDTKKSSPASNRKLKKHKSESDLGVIEEAGGSTGSTRKLKRASSTQSLKKSKKSKAKKESHVGKEPSTSRRPVATELSQLRLQMAIPVTNPGSQQGRVVRVTGSASPLDVPRPGGAYPPSMSIRSVPPGSHLPPQLDGHGPSPMSAYHRPQPQGTPPYGMPGGEHHPPSRPHHVEIPGRMPQPSSDQYPPHPQMSPAGGSQFVQEGTVRASTAMDIETHRSLWKLCNQTRRCFRQLVKTYLQGGYEYVALLLKNPPPVSNRPDGACVCGEMVDMPADALPADMARMQQSTIKCIACDVLYHTGCIGVVRQMRLVISVFLCPECSCKTNMRTQFISDPPPTRRMIYQRVLDLKAGRVPYPEPLSLELLNRLRVTQQQQYQQLQQRQQQQQQQQQFPPSHHQVQGASSDYPQQMLARSRPSLDGSSPSSSSSSQRPMNPKEVEWMMEQRRLAAAQHQRHPQGSPQGPPQGHEQGRYPHGDSREHPQGSLQGHGDHNPHVHRPGNLQGNQQEHVQLTNYQPQVFQGSPPSPFDSSNVKGEQQQQQQQQLGESSLSVKKEADVGESSPPPESVSQQQKPLSTDANADADKN